MSDAMKEALRNRRMKGLDVSIIVGGAKPLHSDDMESEESEDLKHAGSDLAPDKHMDGEPGASNQLEDKKGKILADGEQALNQEHSDSDQDKQLFHEMMKKELSATAPNTLRDRVRTAMHGDLNGKGGLGKEMGKKPMGY